MRRWPEHWKDSRLRRWQAVHRLVLPLAQAVESLEVVDDWFHHRSARDAVAVILRGCATVGASFWAWDAATWAGVLGISGKAFLTTYPRWAHTSARSYAIALAYLFGFTELHLLGNVGRGAVARKVFGQAAVDQAVEQVTSVLHGWGQRSPQVTVRTASLVCHALLLNRSPLLADLSEDTLQALRANMSVPYSLRQNVHSLHRALAALGYVGPPRPPRRLALAPAEGVDPVWADWVQRWHDTSTLPASGRKGRRNQMLRMGRWLAAEHPEVREPGQWTRELCAAWVAAVDRLRIGDYTQNDESLRDRIGEPLMPRTKSGLLAGARQFFRDCQEWGWIPRRFDPARALATPRSIRALIGPDPRVIADDVWAKLLWAGLNLEHSDVYANPVGRKHPIELLRALALTWLFGGLRSDEIVRLRVGCIRWQREDVALPGDTDETLDKDAVCLLDVPVHKTGTAFTKPVDPILGQAIAAWEAVRPTQPAVLDRKTSERVHLLFSYRAQGIGRQYLNIRVIPGPLRQGRRADRRRPRQHHQPSGQVHHRQPALQRQRAHDTVRTSGMARAPKSFRDSALRQDRPDHAGEGIQRRRVLRTQRPHHRGPRRPRRRHLRGRGNWASRGSTTTSATATAPTASSSNVHTEWPAPVAISTPRRTPARRNCWRPRKTSSACWPASRSPTTNRQQSTTGQAALDRLLERLIDVPTPDGATPRKIGVAATATLLPIIAVNQGK